eukprot:COSAG04_NODE_31934_length_254_cov_0.658065_1_plen_22_part_10
MYASPSVNPNLSSSRVVGDGDG